MPTRANWGIIVVASAFVLVLIGGAVYAAYQSSHPSTVTTTSTVSDTTAGDWQGALALIATTTNANGEYIAPKELSPTEALSRELFVKYAQLKQSGASTAEQSKAIDSIVAQNAVVVKPTTVYTLGSIHTSTTLKVTDYDIAVTSILRRSTAIKEYELTTFSKTIGAVDTNGTPTLIQASTVYRSIEADLAKMSVPKTLANEHLALLQSVSSLADTTKLMGTWSGDPVTALVYIDAFTRADHATQVAVAAVYSKMVTLAKK
jgi:hypothetical protein